MSYCIPLEETAPVEDLSDDIFTYMMSDYYKLPMDLHETDSHMYFHACGHSSEDVCFVYDRDGGKASAEGKDLSKTHIVKIRFRD